MHRDDRRDDWRSAGPRPYDETDRPHDADVTNEFWGGTRSWSGRPDTGDQPVVDDAMWADRTGSMRAIRDGLTSWKPRRAEALRRNARGGIDRTRSHGIVRPADARPGDATPEQLPAARRGPASQHVAEATLGELAGGRRRSNPVAPVAPDLDWSDEDWSTPTGRTDRIPTAQADDIEWPDDDWTLPTGRTARVHAEPTGSQRRHVAVPVEPNERRDRREYVPMTSLVERLGLGAVDPLLLRVGVLVLTGALLVGYAFTNRTGSADTIAASGAAAAAVPALTDTVAPTTMATAVAGEAPAAPVATVAPAPVDEPATAPDEGAPAPSDDAAGADDQDDAASTDVGVDDDVDDRADDADASTAAIADEAATVTEPAERVEPDCSLTYTANPGDSWYRIADEAGVSPQAVLDANLADVDAVILPGDEICLPEGATMPSPPTTAAPTTAAAPTTTAAPTTVPSTTAAPTTTAPPIVAPASTAEVQRLIREIWPDELEEKALQVAWRESNYRANVYNGICCYGVFQIHWTSHRSWLDDYGILTTNDLFDARKNITAAYALYQRAGGWGPWGG